MDMKPPDSLMGIRFLLVILMNFLYTNDNWALMEQQA